MYFMSLFTHLDPIVREVEAHVAGAGWDQSARLFALVPTKDLMEANPELSAELGLTGDLLLTSVEQEIEVGKDGLEELLATIAWPDDVVGAIVIVERIVLPPEAEANLPKDSDVELVEAAHDHPDRRDVRILSAVLRTGENLNALRFRTYDAPEDVAIAPDLVPRLNEALLDTFTSD